MGKRKRKTKSKKKTNNNSNNNNQEIRALLFISFGILCAFSLHTGSVGKIGLFIKELLLGFFSKPAYVFPYLIIIYGTLSLNSNFQKFKIKFVSNSAILYLCIIMIYSLNDVEYIQKMASIKTMYNSAIEGGVGGGIIGSIITRMFIYLFGVKGSYLIVITSIIFCLLITTNVSISRTFKVIFLSLKKLLNLIGTFFQELNTGDHLTIEEKSDSTNSKNNDVDISGKVNLVDEKIKILDYTNLKNTEEKNDKNTPVSINVDTKKTKDNSTEEETSVLKINDRDNIINYKMPSIDLLKSNENANSKKDKREILNKAKILEETLNNFGVDAKVVQISKGPTITRYEIQPSPGVKVSKIVNLSDDIALSLAAHTIRIEAPIPGKSAVGIEVPNDNSSIVTLREVIESSVYKKSLSKLTFVLGKDISGSSIVADLSKMPHMLIAGATGSGKSVCVNTLITSILYKSTPEDVKFLLIDPKVVELSIYNGIPHLLLPVVTDPKKAATALNWVVQEMTNRYKLFAQTGVRDVDSYNKKITDSDEEKLPKLVVIIDELADLMMVAPDQVEDAICRLAQMARAAGIHLIVATQRPSVDVITGVIKANIPSRIAFAVSSQADSRTILDMGGAEKLLGRGDMLFYPVGASKPKRVQGAFVSDSEVKSVVEFIKKQVDDVEYEEDIIDNIENSVTNEDVDELLPDAIKLVINTEQASISMLQRKFRIGYNRAARMIDEMESRGIVSGHLGSKPRKVLISKEEYEDAKDKTS